MRVPVLLPMLVTLSIACEARRPDVRPAVSPRTTGGSRPDATPRTEDASVLEAALLHLKSDAEVGGMTRLQGDEIVLHNSTNAKAGMIGRDQMEGEFSPGQLPDEAVTDMRTRNVGEVSLEGLRFGAGSGLVLGDVSSLRDRNDFDVAFAETYPEAKAYAQAWLPGYSADGRRAVVRCWFGPTPHGATATYVLAKDAAGKWSVVFHKLSYYA